MPNSHTFKLPPVARLLKQHLNGGVVVDPFARDSKWATISNDLNPEFGCEYQMDAIGFCQRMIDEGVKADAVLFDPPYSPRQIAECYRVIGRKVGLTDTQNARLYREVKDRLHLILKPGGKAISFGWNSMGFGQTRGYEMQHVLLVTHGGAHNDTICTVETKR